MHRAAGKKPSIEFHGFLLFEVLRAKTFLLPVKKFALTHCVLSATIGKTGKVLQPPARRPTLSALRVQQIAFRSGEEELSLAWPAERSPSPSSPRESHRVSNDADSRTSRLYLWLALRASLDTKRRTRLIRSRDKVNSSVLWSGTAKFRRSSKSSRDWGSWMTTALTAEIRSTVRRTQCR